MKMKIYLNRTFICLLTIIIVVVSAGCATSKKADEIKDMEIEEVVKFSYDAIGGDDVMPLMGFYGPRPNNYSYNANVLPDYYSDEFFELIKESGINLIGTNFTNYTNAPSFVYKLLEQGAKYNLGVYVSDAVVDNSDSITIEELDERINKYANYPAFCGVHVADEPGTPYFRGAGNNMVSDYADITQKLKKLGYSYYVNLYGRLVGSEDDPKAKDVYAQYVKEFAETLTPDYLCYDRYVFDENSGLSRAYLHFQNMEAVKYQAEQSKIPFWVFVQAGAQWNDAKEYFDSKGYFPSKGEFMWMGNTELAFGAKGIAYFPLIQPYWFAYSVTEPFDFQRNGVIGAMGNKTRWFYYTKELNEQIRAIDEVLMNSVSKGIIASGKDATKDMSNNRYLIKSGEFRELQSVDGDSIIGCFNYNGKTAFYVVNYDIKNAQKITLNLNGKFNYEVTKEAKTGKYNSNKIVLELGAGDGALVVFK
ncbi:MAG: hypothetical protein IJT84_04350 [Clostridia bacterium]|nr:hypothetical protein [Clostridia bacterium]